MMASLSSSSSLLTQLNLVSGVQSQSKDKQHKNKRRSWHIVKSRTMNTLLLALAFSGLTVISTELYKEYHYVRLLKTWADAQSYCREMFTDLATVENQDDNNNLLSVIQGSGENAWIGLYDDLIRWKWSLGNADFNDNVDFTSWLSGQPNNGYSNQFCVFMTSNGLWNDYSCSAKFLAVCFDEKGPPMYHIVKPQMTWDEARNYCRSSFTDLASVRNISEHNEILSLLSANTWFGLYRHPWSHWSDLTPTNFTNWNYGQPDNSGSTISSCALVSPASGTWFEANCGETHYFICQDFRSRRKRLNLKFQSEADLTDPSIQQQLLEQLNEKLETDGLSEFKLRWTQADGQTFHKEPKKETQD
ncbi:macrophage mannose receptor 1-like [Oreochromis aureus]|uniref:macrophage mannose receptor 1-like n=1 Tax=Oreochromis aureus TaxID=47969 RepID=UPI0019539E49|nr:macrophage mannose receptor 1-like [Oreochromis aureus]